MVSLWKLRSVLALDAALYYSIIDIGRRTRAAAAIPLTGSEMVGGGWCGAEKVMAAWARDCHGNAAYIHRLPQSAERDGLHHHG
jgi:hypothetical protein